MSAGVLADLVLVVHGLFIVFAVLGALIALIWRLAPLLHLPALAWATYIEWSHGVCPLTPLEVSLRRSAGEAGYTGSFVEHYLVPIIYPDGLTETMQGTLAVALLMLNLGLYAYVATRRGWLVVGRGQGVP